MKVSSVTELGAFFMFTTKNFVIFVRTKFLLRLHEAFSSSRPTKSVVPTNPIPTSKPKNTALFRLKTMIFIPLAQLFLDEKDSFSP